MIAIEPADLQSAQARDRALAQAAPPQIDRRPA
jgi:hypothetical protein